MVLAEGPYERIVHVRICGGARAITLGAKTPEKARSYPEAHASAALMRESFGGYYRER